MNNITLSIPDGVEIYEILNVLKEKVNKDISMVEPELTLKTKMGNIKANIYEFNKTIEVTYEDDFRIAVVGFDERSKSIFVETYEDCEESADYTASTDYIPNIESLLKLNKDVSHISLEGFELKDKDLSKYEPNKVDFDIFQKIKEKSLSETILWEDDFSKHNFKDVYISSTTFPKHTILPNTFFKDIDNNSAYGTTFPKQDFSNFEFPIGTYLYLAKFPLDAKLPEDIDFFNKLEYSDNGFYFDLPLNVIEKLHYYNLDDICFDFSKGNNAKLISDYTITILSEKYKEQIKQGKLILPERE